MSPRLHTTYAIVSRSRIVFVAPTSTNLLVWLSVKNVVMTGFGDITLLDLDTIDLSNLNRQFLFRKKDVKQSKALVRPIRYLWVT